MPVLQLYWRNTAESIWRVTSKLRRFHQMAQTYSDRPVVGLAVRMSQKAHAGCQVHMQLALGVGWHHRRRPGVRLAWAGLSERSSLSAQSPLGATILPVEHAIRRWRVGTAQHASQATCG